MEISTYHIYLFAGLFSLGLIDMYLSRYPIFHPIVLLSAVGWFWGELSQGIILGGTLELIFGIAQIRESRRLNLILYAGGLAIYLNRQTHNINLIMCMTLGLLLALGLQLIMEPLRDWLKWLILAIFSCGMVLLIPFGGDLLGYIPAGLLNYISVAGGILPWIFFAYAVWSLSSKTRQREVTMAIPAIIVGSVINLMNYYWGGLVFVLMYYLLDGLLRHQEVKAIWWMDWVLIIIGAYLLIPGLNWTTIGIFAGVLLLNILLVVRNFAPLEIYFLVLVLGVILSQGRLLF